jgi:hypothetical protein
MTLKVEHDFKQCAHILWKIGKSYFAKSFGRKQYPKSSYTIPKGPLEKKCGEWTKANINAFQCKVTSVSEWKSSTKGGKSILKVHGEGERLPWSHQMGL